MQRKEDTRERDLISFQRLFPRGEWPLYLKNIVLNSNFNVADTITFCAFCFGHKVDPGIAWYHVHEINPNFNVSVYNRFARWYKNFTNSYHLRQRHTFFNLRTRQVMNLNYQPVFVPTRGTGVKNHQN